MYEIDRILISRSKKNKNKLSLYWNSLKRKFFKKNRAEKSKFSGWGIEIYHSPPPWQNSRKKNDEIFNKIKNEILELILNKHFKLSQFDYFDTDYSKIIDELKWRHYIIFNICISLIKLKKNNISLVECGVCDGLTFFFAAKAMKFNDIKFNGYLYDSWSKFDFQEHKDIFDYSYLNVDTVKKNLCEFKDSLFFNEGNIPEIFDKAQNPKNIDFLHIDLNSEKATLDSLKFFYHKLSQGSMVLFDDYSRILSEKNVIDEFFNDKLGNFISLPTGQAIFIKY